MGGDLDGEPEASQGVRVRRVGKRAPDMGESANALRWPQELRQVCRSQQKWVHLAPRAPLFIPVF